MGRSATAGLKAEGAVTTYTSSTCLLRSDNRDADSSGDAVFFSSTSSSVQQAAEGAVQQVYSSYVQQNPDLSHGYSCSSDAAASAGTVTALYSAPVSAGGGAIPSAVKYHEQLMLPASSQNMIQERCFVPLLPAQETTQETPRIRELRAAPVYANQGNPSSCGYLQTSATANQASYGNWWNNGSNVQEHLLLQAAGTDHDAAAGRSASCLHDLGQLHRETLVGDAGQGLALSLSSSQYQPQTSSLQLHSGCQRLQYNPDVEMNNVAALSQTAQTTSGGVANDVITEFSSRSYPAAVEPKFATLSRFRTPAPTGGEDATSNSAIRHESELADCGSAGRRELRPQLFEFGNGSTSDTADTSSIVTNRFATSKFLRAAQELLVEVCRVEVVAPPPSPKRPAKTVHNNMTNWQNVQAPRNFSENINIPAAAAQTSAISETFAARREPAQIGLEMPSAPMTPPLTLIPYHPQYHTAHSLVNAAAGNEDREALLLKKENLLRILNEVEARHMRYREHFTVMMNSFNIHAGAETATPYLDLAFQTMSRHFRTVRDATRKHLRLVTRALGEEDLSRAGRGETSRCHHRNADHQLHYQQRALQHLGILQQHQSWRPQRGLPERAVTILRDWMTKHFLHPYPKDADKLSLAKQTCLTRSQVSNWFINARVRLWKPMVEAMYMEEQRIAAQEATERRQLTEPPGVPSRSLELFRRKLY